MKSVFLILFLITSIASWGQSTEDSIKHTINQLFKAMKEADSTAVVNLFAPGAVLHSIGKEQVKTESVATFGATMNKLKKGQLDERIEFGAIHIDANLASVWTPYRLYFDGKFMHCGADSFQMVRFGSDWKIVHLIDTRRKNCD